MNITIVDKGSIPVLKYGGTSRVIWYLGKELSKMGHQVTYIVREGSSSPFAKIIPLNEEIDINKQIPEDTDIVHFNFTPKTEVNFPYVVTIHGNINNEQAADINSIFVSENHAKRHGSNSFVANGLDWDDYGSVNLDKKEDYLHFLGKAAWRVKNVQGAIDITKKARTKLHVLGGKRLNFKMGFRFTLSSRITFHGMVGGEEKLNLIRPSKGLIFPVRWHEPFGLAITESLYMGCPVFGTPYGSLPEIVHKEVGFLSNNENELVEAVKNVDSFSTKRCHEYARDCYNSRVMAVLYLRKYEKVINGETLNEITPKAVKIQEEKFLDYN